MLASLFMIAFIMIPAISVLYGRFRTILYAGFFFVYLEMNYANLTNADFVAIFIMLHIAWFILCKTLDFVFDKLIEPLAKKIMYILEN